MLNVGKHNNVAFSATKNEKGTLVINAKVVEEDVDFNLDEVTTETESEASQNFLVFPLQLKGYVDGQLVDERPVKNIVEDIKNLRTMLTYILSQYTTTDNIEWDLYKGSDITTENQKDALATTEGLKVVYDNLVDQFVAQMKDFADDSKLFRIILVRSSKKSHYPKLRDKYLNSAPFMESMDIPEAQSKLAFSKSEIERGMNDGTPVESDVTKKEESLADSGL